MASPPATSSSAASSCGRRPSSSSAAAPERFVTGSSPHALRKILLAWPLTEQRHFLEREVGIPLAVEPGTDPGDRRMDKLFPASGRARDVRDGLLALAERRGVERRF